MHAHDADRNMHMTLVEDAHDAGRRMHMRLVEECT
jgi:hypothetical protein